MKKILKVMSFVVVTMIIGVFAFAYVSFNSFSPEDPEVEVDISKLSYFQKSYVESREAFYLQVKGLKTKFNGVQLFYRKVPSKIDNDLTIDFCYIPAQKEPKKLLIFSSGVHGVEGFVGSAVQQMFMNEVLDGEMLDEVGILLVHGINPYGFKYIRRVTENNIDFNRNCHTENSLFASGNDGYEDLYGMLNPEGKADLGSLKNKFFMMVAINKLLKESMASLRQAVLQGQYEYDQGLYFGGNRFEPQLEILSEVFKEVSSDYDTVFNIDLHTGFGERGTSHLFPNPIDDNKVKASLETIFAGYEINWGDSKDFYIINGSFTDYIGKLLPDKFYLPMMLEFGTLNSKTTLGSVKSIHNMVMENQGTQYGYKSTEDSLKIKQSFMEMYNPSSDKWRTKIMNDSKVILKRAMTNYSEL
jgi:hypothetical protein